jgi:hypothetical protein
MSRVLEGTALGRRKGQTEEVLQPLYFIRDFLQIARDPELDDERRSDVLNRLSGETDKLITMMADYFDRPGINTEQRSEMDDHAGENDTHG